MRNDIGNRAPDDLSFLDARGNPVNYLLNPPVPQLTSDQFIDEILQINSNKVILYQMKNIQKLTQLNKINEQNIQSKQSKKT